MAKDLTTTAAAVPDHIRARFDVVTNSDLSAGITGGFPVISYKGKVWALVKGGERTLMTNDEGDPRASIEVVIVKAAPSISKTYYESGFEEGTSEAPDCHSFDGVAPSADATNPQAKACASCPRNVWGSKITDNGKKGRECADLKRLAVVDPEDMDEPCLLRVPAASLKYLAQFSDLLSKRGAPYQAVVTKIGFDPTVAHPQFTFKAVRWLEEAELDKVVELTKSDGVARILGLDGGAHAAAAPVEEDDELPPPPAHITGKAAPAQAAPAPAAKPKPAAKAKAQLIPTEEELAAAIEGEGEKVVDLGEARASKQPRAQSEDAILADADEKLNRILASLDDDD